MAENSRITIRETADGLGIYNPTRRNIPVILFLCLWLAGWTVGEFFALTTIFSGESGFAGLFLLVWVTFWTIGGFFAFSVVLWQLFGVEKLFITGGAMVREVGFWNVTRRKVWPLDEVTGVREGTPRGDAGSVFSPGSVEFEVAGAKRSFGIQLDKAERDAVLEAINRHLPAGKAERQELVDTIANIARIKKAGKPGVAAGS